MEIMRDDVVAPFKAAKEAAWARQQHRAWCEQLNEVGIFDLGPYASDEEREQAAARIRERLDQIPVGTSYYELNQARGEGRKTV